MDAQKLNEVLRLHKLWILRDPAGIRANLGGANLRWANLSGADLSGANLEGASLSGAKDIPSHIADILQVCPEAGGFTAYKKLQRGRIATLYIPPSAQRSSATTRKCRASKAKVIAITDATGKAYNEGFSDHESGFIYKVGEFVEPTTPFDPDRWNECASGIHFFITKGEARRY